MGSPVSLSIYLKGMILFLGKAHKGLQIYLLIFPSWYTPFYCKLTAVEPFCSTLPYIQMRYPVMKTEVQEKFDSYPGNIRPLMFELRKLILSVAEDFNLAEVDETLKWGEPSYSVKNGSPVRMDWKPKTPNQYFLFFHCQTKLVDTFRELYSDYLEFQGNRAVVLDVNKQVPVKIIRHCIELAFRYKHIKHLPLLGA
jgi:hypothetical protein